MWKYNFIACMCCFLAMCFHLSEANGHDISLINADSQQEGWATIINELPNEKDVTAVIAKVGEVVERKTCAFLGSKRDMGKLRETLKWGNNNEITVEECSVRPSLGEYRGTVDVRVSGSDMEYRKGVEHLSNLTHVVFTFPFLALGGKDDSGDTLDAKELLPETFAMKGNQFIYFLSGLPIITLYYKPGVSFGDTADETRSNFLLGIIKKMTDDELNNIRHYSTNQINLTDQTTKSRRSEVINSSDFEWKRCDAISEPDVYRVIFKGNWKFDEGVLEQLIFEFNMDVTSGESLEDAQKHTIAGIEYKLGVIGLEYNMSVGNYIEYSGV